VLYEELLIARGLKLIGAEGLEKREIG